MDKPTLYVLPASHPAYVARKVLELKGIDYRRVDLIPVLHRAILRLKGFPGNTVPALRTESGERIQTSIAIARYLDRRQPEPPLYPQAPDARKRVEAAEDWGDEVLQPIPRRLTWWALSRNTDPARAFLEQSHIGLPTWLALATLPLIARIARSQHGVDDDAVRRDLSALPEHLDRVDAWIADGTLGGDTPNAADFQIGSTLRLLLAFEDFDPLMRNRPLAELARRIVPDYPGRFPPTFPPDWLPAPTG